MLSFALDTINMIFFLYFCLILLGKKICNYSFLRLLHIVYIAELVMVVFTHCTWRIFSLLSCGACNSPVPPPVCLPVNFPSKNVTCSWFEATRVACLKWENLAFSELLLNKVNKNSFLCKDQNLAHLAWLLCYPLLHIWSMVKLSWGDSTRLWNKINWWADNCICYQRHQSVFLRMCPLSDPSLRYSCICKTAWFHLQGFHVLNERAVVLSTATQAHREILTERQGLLEYGGVCVLYSFSCLSETIILFVSHTWVNKCTKCT